MLTRLAALYQWNPQDVTDFDVVRSRMMLQAFLFVVVLGIVLFPIQLALGPPWLAVLPLSHVLGASLGIVLVRNGRQQLAAWFVLSGWMAIATLTIGLAGDHQPGPTGLFFVPGIIASVLWLRSIGAGLMIALHFAVLALAGPLDELGALDVQLAGPALHSAMILAGVLSVAVSSMLAGSAVQSLAQVHNDAQNRALEARAASAHARKASEAKAAFLATMSHELRTPLNAILGYTELLRDTSAGDHEDLDRMHAAANELLTLVDGVLEVARSEATLTSQRREAAEVDLVKVIRSAKDSVSRYAPQFELDVVAPADQVLVRSHESRLRRVVTQLLVHSAHSLAGGRIQVVIGTLDDGVQIAFPARSETGLAIAVAQRLAESIGGIVTAPTSPPATVGILTLFLDVEVIA